MWPLPRWPPPTAEENALYADGWEQSIAAKVKEAEEEALAEAAAAATATAAAAAAAAGGVDAVDDSRSSDGGGGGGGAVLSAATVEANTGSSHEEVKTLDLGMEGLGDVSALPLLCPKLRTLGRAVQVDPGFFLEFLHFETR